MISQFHQDMINEIDNPSADQSYSQEQVQPHRVTIREPAASPTLDEEKSSFDISQLGSDDENLSPSEKRVSKYNQKMKAFKKEKERIMMNRMSVTERKTLNVLNNISDANSNSKQSKSQTKKSSSRKTLKAPRPMITEDDTNLKKRKLNYLKVSQSLNIDINQHKQRAQNQNLEHNEDGFDEFSKNSKHSEEEEHSHEDHSGEEEHRHKAPPRPMAYQKWAMQQKGMTGGDIMGNMDSDEDDETSKLYEAMSYEKLIKKISNFHPVDVETKQRFQFNERCTVKDFESKLSDVCGCIWIKKKVKVVIKCCSKVCLPSKRRKPKFKPPDSIGMVAEDNSGSTSESEGQDKGLTKCSQSIGDGAALYIQMMYTFTIMFLILTLLNLPIYIMYENSTQGNNLSSLETVFKYFTLGNLGQFTKQCSFSDFAYRFDANLKPPENLIKVDCEKGVIAKIINFGFMYSYDQEYGGDADGFANCNHIENPMDPYKWAPPQPLVCDEDELGIVELELCQIELREVNGEIQEDERVYLQCLVKEQGNIDICAPIFQYNHLGKNVFVNREQDTPVAWITNPSCDGEKYVLNYNNGSMLSMTAQFTTNPVTNQKHIDSFLIGDSPLIQGNPEMFTSVEVLYQEYDGQLLGLKIYQTDYYEASQENPYDIELEQDLCDEPVVEVIVDPMDLVNVLNTDEWAPSGAIPEIPNTDQYQEYANIDPKCGFQNQSAVIRRSPLFQDRQSQQMFLKYFDENCFEKKECVLDPAVIGYQMGDQIGMLNVTRERTGLFGLISDRCKYRMSNEVTYQNITSQSYIGIFGCKYDDVEVPLLGSGTRVHKEIVGVIAVTADFICMLIVIYFFTKLESLNNEFLDNVDDLRVQMKDFGVIIENVILDKYTYDSRIIKMKVWLHFKQLLEPKKAKFQDLSCIDVTLSLYSQPSIQLVFRMQEIQLEINEIKTKLVLNEYKDSQIPNKQDRLRFLDEKRERFEKRYATLVTKIAHDSQTDAILSVKRVPKPQRIKQIQYIYVIFRGCETSEIILSEYQDQSGPEACINYLSKSLMPDTFVDNTLFGKQITVKPIVEPDEIIWQNLAFTVKEQKLRATITQIISFFCIISNAVFTIYLKGFQISLNRFIPDPVGCPDTAIPKNEAYEDYMKDFDESKETKSIGLMACYCKEETNLFLPWTIAGHSFQEFSNGNLDDTNHCFKWHSLQLFKQFTMSVVSSSAVIINELLAVFFQIMGKFQKKHTKIEEQINCFRQIFVQEYINMGIITLVTSFDRVGLNEIILGENSQNFNVYENFDPNWYMDYGNKICVFIFMSSFLINAKDMSEYVKKEIVRCWDRRGKTNLKADPDDEDCDLPNSRHRVQLRLEQLYMGNIFKGEKNFSRMMSTLFVILTYCSGMPIMYLNGFIFYLVTYCVNKFLILSFYQKSRTLTRSIPLFTAEILRYGIVIHLVMSLFMLTNKDGFKTQTTHQGVSPLIDLNKQKFTEEKEASSGTEQASNSDQGSQLLRNRFFYMHQQMYFAYLLIIVFSYLIGKNTKIILSIIVKGLLKMFMSCFNTLRNCCSKHSKAAKIQMKQSIQKQNENFEIALKKRFQIEIKTKEQKNQEKLELRQNEALKREQEEQEYLMRKVQELEACTGPVETNNLLERHFNEDGQRELDEQERIEREEEEDNTQCINQHCDKEKNHEQIEEQERIAKQKEEKERQERELEEDRLNALEQLNKRFERPDYSEDIYIEFSTESLQNFYQRCNRELEEFWEIFQYNYEIPEDLLSTDNQSPYKDLFLETCYTYRISVDDAFIYQKFLKERIRDLEVVIDRYMKLLKQTLIEKMESGFERDRRKRKNENKEGSLKDQVAQTKYEKWFVKHSDQVRFEDPKYYPYIKKLKILVLFQEELIHADCNRKDNKLGIQDICRMTGSLSQSYFIFDAQEYKVARRIYYNLDKQELAEESEQLDEGEDEDEQDVKSQQSDKTKFTKRSKPPPSKYRERKKSGKSMKKGSYRQSDDENEDNDKSISKKSRSSKKKRNKSLYRSQTVGFDPDNNLGK